ncbi:peptidase M56 [Colwellia sp. MT41]|uniref:M56 family metallopeptidase n=1 Tax=Colwellia sp. MT41 TaxID=58049 RepID=UPI0007178A91|nr:M56 family metallopeptidase [Colwellia sp. MT41]ALO35911.1 peptidase M56 [Colwellia sp. MT41]
MLEQLFNSPFLYSLSLTLVHFLWQGLLVAFILKSALFIIDKSKPILRYALAILAMLTNACLAILTFVMVYPDTNSGINSNLSPIALTSLVHELTQKNALLNYHELLPSILAYSLPYLSLLWLAIITALACKLLIEVRNVNNLPMYGSVSPSAALLARFDELAQQIKLTKTPKLLISLKAEVPMAIGWLKPVVLLPASMVTGLSSAQLEMLILHELAHIRRHDYLVNFLQTLIELLFFFHPSVHWIGKQIRNEREYCSDDIAVQHCGDAIAYAHTLTDTASLCAKANFHTIPTMAMAATGGDLKARVLRIVDHHCAPSNNASKWLAAISLLLALTLLSINQLLTMPYAQQLNNHFPWQKNNAFSPYVFQKNVSAVELNKTLFKQENTKITKDSIAQQLLNSQVNTTNSSPVDPADSQSDVSLVRPNDIALTTAMIEPSFQQQEQVIAEPAIKMTAVSAPVPSQVANRDKVQITKVTLTDKQKKPLEKSFNSRINTAQHKVTNPAEDGLNAKLTAEKAILSVSVVEQSLIKTSATMVAPTQSSSITKVTKSTAAINLAAVSATLDYPEQGNRHFPVQFNNKFHSNNSPYAQFSYRQELNELAVQDELYTASHALASTTALIKKTSKETIATPRSHVAKLLNSISPIYPTLAKRRGIEMEVKVNFTIDLNGKVKDIHFSQQSKLIYFKSAIRSALRKWRFSPATKNNRNVNSKMSKIFSFSLHA